jgi:hypothetical protein
VEVFLDRAAIRGGDKWVATLQNAIEKAQLALVLIGPAWVMASDGRGRRRLSDPEDFVRREIEYSLKEHCELLPVLVGGSQMPGAKELPKSLVAITEVQACVVRDDHFDADTDALLRRIVDILDKRQKELDEFIAMAKGSTLHVSDPRSFSTFGFVGDWSVEVKMPQAVPVAVGLETLALDRWRLSFTIDGSDLEGSAIALGRGAFGRPVKRKQTLKGTYQIRFVKDKSGDEIVTGILLDAVLESGSPLQWEIVIDRGVGDAYLGTDRWGNEFVSKLVRAPREGL